MLNRCVVTVKAREPFLQWLTALPDQAEVTPDEMNRDATAYLLQDYAMDDEREEILEHYYDMIFEEELSGWCANEKDWPANRSFAVFKQWFDVTFHAMVLDLVEEPLEDDERE